MMRIRSLEACIKEQVITFSFIDAQKYNQLTVAPPLDVIINDSWTANFKLNSLQFKRFPVHIFCTELKTGLDFVPGPASSSETTKRE